MQARGDAATAAASASLSARLASVTGKNRFLTAAKAVSAVKVLEKGGRGVEPILLVRWSTAKAPSWRSCQRRRWRRNRRLRTTGRRARPRPGRSADADASCRTCAGPRRTCAS
ncbi:hypothetical protein MTO96_002652 [Rhipicephalus appendiculatus]